MFKRKTKLTDYDTNQELNDNYNINDYYDEPDVDDILDDICPKSKSKTSRKKSTDKYYVKGSDLLEEIKKYRESKQQDADKRRCTI